MTSPDKTPLYETVKNRIIEKIHTELSLGDKLPTEAELMQEFQVSRITITKAMKQLKDLGYIQRYPRKGTFVISKNRHSADDSVLITDAASSSAHYQNIMCLIPHVEDTFALNLLKGITTELPPDKYNIHLIQSHNQEKEDYLLKQCAFSRNYQGLLLVPVDQSYYSNHLLRMKLNDFPIVLIDRTLPGIQFHHVIIDNIFSGELVFQHLFSLGHRSFLFISNTSKDLITVKGRIKGMWKGAENAGLSPRCVNIIEHLDLNKPVEYFCSYLESILRQYHTTAIVCCETRTCLYVYSLLQQLNLNVPKDISLISFDNPTNTLSNFNFFTHIDQHEHAMGCKAAAILREEMENDSAAEEHKSIILTPTLEVRSSTAPVFR